MRALPTWILGLSALVTVLACAPPSEAARPSRCDALDYRCGDRGVSARRVTEVPADHGLSALVSSGDVVLENSRVIAVIDALDHPHYLAPTGGNLLDLEQRGRGNDTLTHLFHAAGLLPGDSVAYDSLALLEREGEASVEARGHLAGFPEIRVTTRYTLRACEPGVRVATTITNGSVDAASLALLDVWYWSGRTVLPFTPGVGFASGTLSLTEPPPFERAPFFAATSYSSPSVSFFEIPCSEDEPLEGLHTEFVSAVGRAARLVAPGDTLRWERFVGVADGSSIAPAIDAARDARAQLFGERFATVRGRVVSAMEGGAFDDVRGAVTVYSGPADAELIQGQAVPGVDGAFSLRVPRASRYRVELQAFGATLESRVLAGDRDEVDAGELVLRREAEARIHVRVDGLDDYAWVFVRPADEETRERVRSRMLGGFEECAPLLGSPTGGSPACGRLITHGASSIRVPPGRYDFHAFAGIYATVSRRTVEFEPAAVVDVDLELTTLPLAPRGSLSADFHVHGAASFDSTLPDLDRVASFLASRVDVIAATDHDVVWDYADARAMLGADARVHVLTGVETTGHILFDLVPGRLAPQVIGHWIAWPLPFAADQPYRGAPWDELAEPGTLFGRLADAGWPVDRGVLQLNHPWAAGQVGRDFGFPRAAQVDLREPLPLDDDGGAAGLLVRTPAGARFSNLDYHAQEVMNGTANRSFQPYRAYWFYLMNQGVFRAGTANSDSHSLVDSVLGTPRNVVLAGATGAVFDADAFNAAVRAGRMFGTTGPLIEAALVSATGGARGPSTRALTPEPGASLRVIVRAAPWVPVDEVRVIVNGRVALAFEAELLDPSDPLGSEGLERLNVELPLSMVLTEPGVDAWIVVEAGARLAINGDLDCNGVPDTGDNDQSGEVDWHDVDRNGDRLVDAADLEGLSQAPPCERGATVGPLGRPPVPERGDRGSTYRAVTPGGYPTAFTNPLILDFAGDGFDPPQPRR